MECNLAKVSALMNGKRIIPELFVAKSAWQRTRGLLGRGALSEFQGLWIKQCHSIHMVGMKYSLDLCYLDANGKVLKIVNQIKPWQFSACSGAKSVIEMLKGMNRKLEISVGEHIDIEQ